VVEDMEEVEAMVVLLVTAGVEGMEELEDMEEEGTAEDPATVTVLDMGVHPVMEADPGMVAAAPDMVPEDLDTVQAGQAMEEDRVTALEGPATAPEDPGMVPEAPATLVRVVLDMEVDLLTARDQGMEAVGRATGPRRESIERKSCNKPIILTTQHDLNKIIKSYYKLDQLYFYLCFQKFLNLHHSSHSSHSAHSAHSATHASRCWRVGFRSINNHTFCGCQEGCNAGRVH